MYQNIIPAAESATNVTHACVWVLPKSGTIHMRIFFHVYNKLLHDESITDADLVLNEADKKLFAKEYFVVEHAEFDGFQNLDVEPEKLALWQKLQYGLNIPWEMEDERSKTLLFRVRTEPHSFLSNCKIVFIYRNPLDQMISYYNHFRALPPNSLTWRIDMNKLSIGDFIFKHGALDSYIRMFYTFHIAKKHYPDLIMFVPYEEMIADRHTIIKSMMQHLQIPFNDDAFTRALSLTSIDNLRQVENRLNRDLINPNPDVRHIRNGGVGVWKNYLSEDQIHAIEVRLNEFDLSLAMFNGSPDMHVKRGSIGLSAR